MYPNCACKHRSFKRIRLSTVSSASNVRSVSQMCVRTRIGQKDDFPPPLFFFSKQSSSPLSQMRVHTQLSQTLRHCIVSPANCVGHCYPVTEHQTLHCFSSKQCWSLLSCDCTSDIALFLQQSSVGHCYRVTVHQISHCFSRKQCGSLLSSDCTSDIALFLQQAVRSLLSSDCTSDIALFLQQSSVGPSYPVTVHDARTNANDVSSPLFLQQSASGMASRSQHGVY